jgi:L-lysine 2,3-aminomutase
MNTTTIFNLESILNQREISEEVKNIIINEKLLHEGTLRRLHLTYPEHSAIIRTDKQIFKGKERYAGLSGFRQILEQLQENGIEIGHIKERELFIEVYRFLATKHVLNLINWEKFEKDSLFQLVFPQPGMINKETVDAYINAKDDEERAKIVKEYQLKTNPHDGKQKLNKPWFSDENCDVQVLEGSQHKYPPCQLIFDKTTQNCFAFCNYCFRHAQVRGDEDMFIQEDIDQVHNYLRRHKEVTDILITGGDAGYITFERLEKYALPLIEDDELMHIRTLRLGSRALTYLPELILSEKFNNHLELFSKLRRNGVQVLWMSHFSTPRELLNPLTIAAINRLRNYEVTLKSQSPIMKHISLFVDENGNYDIDKSAQNWIDLGNIFATLGIGFHSMYCARPTGEYHYFTAPLDVIDKVFSKVYKTLASINRPSRFITQTSSAGKISLLGTTTIDGEKVFVLKFNEGRNMDWMDTVFLAKFDPLESSIIDLIPYKSEKHFFEDELIEIEKSLEEQLIKALNKQTIDV